MVTRYLPLVVFLVFSCGGKTEEKKDVSATETPEGEEISKPIEKCPDEVDLTTVQLPCDCYGHIVEDPEKQVPGCKTQVVCCPETKDIRCEDDHKLDIIEAKEAEASEPEIQQDVTQNEIVEVAADINEVMKEVIVKNCPYEVDLSKVELPCNCKGVIVEDVKKSMPNCNKTVKCCPMKGLVCE